ncbi:hypothetical protein SNARM312S_00764 [Streptomyces narbonensis]
MDPVHPFPYISGLSLNLAVVVRNPVSGHRHFARVKVPPLLSQASPQRYVPLEDVIGTWGVPAWRCSRTTVRTERDLESRRTTPRTSSRPWRRSSCGAAVGRRGRCAWRSRSPSTPRQASGAAAAGLTVGAARAGALLERQLTLARTRAHSAALQALGSARFHAVADAVALLASEVPLGPAGAAPATEVVDAPAGDAERRLLESVAALPLTRAAHPYNSDALALAAGESQDAPWHRTRHLLRLHRYASEVLHTGGEPDPVLFESARALDRHRDAAEAAAAAAAAARTPRIAPATAYALGVLHADQRHEVEAARFAFQHAWRRATAPVS